MAQVIPVQLVLVVLLNMAKEIFWEEGKALSFAIKTGKDDQLYEFSFYEPMFLRNDLGFGINLSAKGY